MGNQPTSGSAMPHHEHAYTKWKSNKGLIGWFINVKFIHGTHHITSRHIKSHLKAECPPAEQPVYRYQAKLDKRQTDRRIPRYVCETCYVAYVPPSQQAMTTGGIFTGPAKAELDNYPTSQANQTEGLHQSNKQAYPIKPWQSKSTLQLARRHDGDHTGTLGEAGSEDAIGVLEHAVLQGHDDEL